jgi:hypothetical protein
MNSPNDRGVKAGGEILPTIKAAASRFSQLSAQPPAVPAQPAAVPAQPPASVDDVALRSFANDLGDIVSKNRADDEKRLVKLRKRESILFGTSIVTAILVPVLIVFGLILLFTLNSHVAGGLTTAAGALSGAGSAGLFTLRRQTVKEIRPIDEKSDLDEHLYRALQIAGMISDPQERARTLAGLASDIMRQNANRRIEIEEERT